ncbi:MAG: ABC transporter substrate-binding protein [Oscillospiraceae bacterium]|nr:ABC transporter substrate-binding protein [Oscillospiraceae bacterium]
MAADLATDYTVSDDGLIYTIPIKSGVYYSYQGKIPTDDTRPQYEVQAKDFVFALQRVFTKETASPYADTLSAIQNSGACLNGTLPVSALGVKALDAYTLQITLAFPDPEFITKLCCPGAMPCNQTFFEGTYGSYGLDMEHILSSGDFRITLWDSTDGVTLRRNTTRKGYVERIRLLLPSLNQDGTPADTPIQRLDNETTDLEIITGDLTSNSYRQNSFSTTTWVLAFNCANPQLSNANIRLALASVAYRTPLEKNEHYTFAEGLVPPNVTMLDTSFREYAGSVADIYPQDVTSLLKAGLQELSAQMSQGKETPVVLEKLSGLKVLVPTDSFVASYFDSINQMWQKELGAFFSVSQVSDAELETAYKSGSYDIILLPLSMQQNDVYSILTHFATGDKTNYTRFVSAAFDAEIAEIAATGNMTKRTTLYRQAERNLLIGAPVVPLFYENSTLLTVKWLENIVFSPFGPVVDVTNAYKK